MKKVSDHRGAFLLLETMIGVAVFAIGVLALARCVSRTLDAQIAVQADQRARRALENRLAEIEGGAAWPGRSPSGKALTGEFAGITLRQSASRLELKNEGGVKLPGMTLIRLEAAWAAPQGKQSRELSFYAFKPE